VRAGGTAAALGRGLGFALLATAGLGLLAAVVLLPAWAAAQRADYQRACLHADLADARAYSRALRRYADALDAGHDETLVQRHLARYLNLPPPGQPLPVTHVAAGGDAPPIGRGEAVVLYEPAARPAPPSPRLLALAERLQRARLRRGLLLLAALSVAAGLLLFAPRHKPHSPQPVVRGA